MDRLGLHTSSYEGMTGIIGVLHTACTEAGLRTASIWASVPHYVAAAANPKATLALLRKVEMIAGPSVELSELELAAAEYERQVGLAVQSDPDIQAFVERLERDSDTENEDLGPEDLPSGESLAREFQRFLRQRGDDR
jgi:predicted ATP-grasp superfamily ATP-dependent carboligase